MLAQAAVCGPDVLREEWTWMRVYYFEPRKDSLIVDGVWPSLQAACERHGQRTAYFQRDWNGGPNILVGVRKCCDLDDPRAVVDRIADYIAANPSKSIVEESAYASQALRFGVLENVDVVEPLHANNSVAIVDEPIAALLTQDASKEAVRAYLNHSATLCIDWLNSVRAGTLDRNRLALQLMVALLWVANPETLKPYLSLRSHAEGYLRLADKSNRERFRAHYENHAGSATKALLEETIEALSNDREIVPGMSRFVALMRSTLADFYEGIASREYKVASMWKSSIDQSPAFRSWQVTISLLYRTLNQLGVAPVERFLACYLLGRAVEEREGRGSWDWDLGPINLETVSRQRVEESFTCFAGSEARNA